MKALFSPLSLRIVPRLHSHKLFANSVLRGNPARPINPMAKRKRSTTAAKPFEGTDDAVASSGDVDAAFSSEFSPSAGEEEDDYIPIKPEKAATALSKKKPAKNAAKPKKTPTAEDIPLERPPETDSDYVPIPFKGRLGFACLNTYLRTSNPPIFCSRTCRIDTILKQGKQGMEYVQNLGLTNARDLVKLIQFNEKYGIKFMRISSEMFPFASHKVYGYDVGFAEPVLRKAGELAMKHGHRLTMHPGQFTQLASPRKEVIEASVKDLEYHSQLLRALGLKGQADKDAVMILHMGGTFGDKPATIARFEENYTTLLSDDIKARIVLENDDVCWTVHDLLPTCKKLNIPLVLDYHHHNILHDPSVRAGTLDIMQLFPEIKETWTRKGITQKQHYSEPCPGTVTARDMRKHSPRVKKLPPCADNMDLMIEAKDKEQAVFELFKIYNIGVPLGDVIPHTRTDENVPEKKTGKKKVEAKEEKLPIVVLDDDIGMGGPENRVYWPQGHEEWLSPVKRVRKKKEEDGEQLEDAEEKPKKKPRKARAKAEVKEDDELMVEEAKKPAKKTRITKAAVKVEEEEEMENPAPKRSRKAKAVVKEEDMELDIPTEQGRTRQPTKTLSVQPTATRRSTRGRAPPSTPPTSSTTSTPLSSAN